MPIDREAVRRQHRHLDVRSDPRNPIVVLADNVDKLSNMGGILRTADAFRCEAVLTNRTEPDPAGAMGAEHWQPVEWQVDIVAAAHEYRVKGYALIALEQDDRAVPINEFAFPRRCVLMIGAEMYGVSEALLDMADSIVYIPQAGLIKSLNVAGATAVALYEYSRQHWMPGYVQPKRHLQPAASSLRVERAREPAGSNARG